LTGESRIAWGTSCRLDVATSRPRHPSTPSEDDRAMPATRWHQGWRVEAPVVGGE